MLSKKLVGPLGVLAAIALTPVAGAHASHQTATSTHTAGTQVGPEDNRTAKADGIIAILIGATSGPASEPPHRHLDQDRMGHHHSCPLCPHPGIGAIVPRTIEYPNTVL